MRNFDSGELKQNLGIEICMYQQMNQADAPDSSSDFLESTLWNHPVCM